MSGVSGVPSVRYRGGVLLVPETAFSLVAATVITIPTNRALEITIDYEWVGAANACLYAQLNGDTAANYTFAGQDGVNNGSLSGSGSGGATAIPLCAPSAVVNSAVGGNYIRGQLTLYRPNGARNARAGVSFATGITGASNLRAEHLDAQWNNAAAIASVTILGDSAGGPNGPAASLVLPTAGTYFVTGKFT